MKCAGLLAFCAALMLFHSPAASAQSGQDDSFRELALRSLTYPGAPEQDLRLYPGGVPDDFPVPLAYPDDSRLLGTVARTYETTVFISSALPAAAVMQFYYDHFKSAGWQTQEWPRWGFASAADAYPTTYCRGDEGPWVNLMAQELKAGDTDVRITMNGTGDGITPCAQATMERGMDFPPLPFLTMPPDAEMTSGGSGGGMSGEIHAAATIRTDLSAEAVAAHFIAQLTRSGWKETGAGADAVTYWRVYDVTDAQGRAWSGQFFITRLPGQEKLTAYVLATPEYDRENGPAGNLRRSARG